MVRSPLTWVLTYSGFAPARLPDLLATHEVGRRPAAVRAQPPPAARGHRQLARARADVLGAALPAHHEHGGRVGSLPLTRIGLAVSTSLPSDDVILESAALTGMDAFEEVVNLDDIKALGDPLQDRLLTLARQHAPDLL